MADTTHKSIWRLPSVSLGQIFARRSVNPREAALIDLVKELSSEAYHSSVGKGGESMHAHADDVRIQVRKDWGHLLGIGKLAKEEFQFIEMVADGHDICELKDTDGNIIWTRDKLTSYRGRISGAPLPQEYIDHLVNIGQIPGQPYFNYIDDLLFKNLYTKHSDAKVNMMSGRVSPYANEMSPSFQLKKSVVYPAVIRYSALVIDGKIDRTQTNLMKFICTDPEIRALVPDTLVFDRSWYDPQYTHKLTRRDALTGGTVASFAALLAAGATKPTMK